jgi:hypothetical protein
MLTGITLPILLTIAAVIAAISAYRGIRRGGARFYTLERETMLRRAGFTLLGSMALFLAAIALLVFNYQQLTNEGVVNAEDEGNLVVTATSEPQLESQPPTPSPTATTDPSIPTPTATPIICRAIVDGTSGSGLTLREVPGGPEVSILPDGTILTLLEEEPQDVNGFMWRMVRTVGRDEGWVVEEFLKMGDCN